MKTTFQSARRRGGMAGAMRFPEKLTLFRKSLLTLSGVIGDVAGESPMDAVQVLTGLRQYRRDLSFRGMAPCDPHARRAERREPGLGVVSERSRLSIILALTISNETAHQLPTIRAPRRCIDYLPT